MGLIARLEKPTVGRLFALLGFTAAACVYGGWQWVFQGIHSYNTSIFPLDDADEWRYTACSRLVAHGYALFTQVFSAQPPMLFLSLAGGMHLFGDSIGSARLVEVAFGAISLVSVGWIAWMISGPVGAGAATVVLAVSPLFLVYSRAVEAEGPMMAMSTLGLALALRFNRSGTYWLCALAGVSIAGAILFKLFAVAALVPALWTVAVRRESTRARVWASAVLVAAAIVPVVLELALVSPTAQWSQVVSLHDRASSLDLPNALSNARILQDAFTVDIGLTVLAMAGVIALMLAAEWEDSVFLALWMGGFSGMLAVFHPLFPHHAVIVLTALAASAGIGIGMTWSHVSRTTWHVSALPLLGLALYLVATPRIAHDDRHMLVAWNGISADAVAAYLRSHSAPRDFVAADDLAAADISGRLVPPSLCDPSTVRLLAGYLSAGTLIEGTGAYRAQVVAPTRGIYVQVPAYMSWVRSHYRRVPGPAGTTLYVRR